MPGNAKPKNFMFCINCSGSLASINSLFGNLKEKACNCKLFLLLEPHFIWFILSWLDNSSLDDKIPSNPLYLLSPTIGEFIDSRWTLNWWVLPVFGLRANKATLDPTLSRTLYSVIASLPLFISTLTLWLPSIPDLINGKLIEPKSKLGQGETNAK